MPGRDRPKDRRHNIEEHQRLLSRVLVEYLKRRVPEGTAVVVQDTVVAVVKVEVAQHLGLPRQQLVFVVNGIIARKINFMLENCVLITC